MPKVLVELPVLLPEAADAREACVARLQSRLTGRPEVLLQHVKEARDGLSPTLCIHYDPQRTTAANLERIVTAEGAAVAVEIGHTVLPIRAVAGEDAGRRIEGALTALPGVLAAAVNLAAQRVRVEFERARISESQLEVALADLRFEEPSPSSPSQGWYPRNRELAWSLGAGVLLAIGWRGESQFGWTSAWAVPIFVLSYILGGADLVRHTLITLRRGAFTFDIDLLMLLAALGAAALGEWAEGAFLLFLFSLAHALEHYALGRARAAIEALSELAPLRARLLQNGIERDVPVEDVRVSDIVVVRPADRIPVDGVVRGGRSAVNQAPVTGESVPVEKAVGDTVFAGTVNGDGALEIETTGAVGDRTLDRVIKLVAEAQTQKAPTQTFTDRFERVFVPAVLVADVLLLAVPPLLGWWTWQISAYRAMAFLVAASPCALALGTPAAVLAGIAQAARHGVLIKGGAYLESLGKVRAMAFDKTGTLTIGRPEVTDVAPANGVDEKHLLTIAAAVERRSQHPLAQAVVRHAEAARLALPAAGDLESITGRGVRSTVDGQPVEIGAERLWENQSIPEEIRSSVQRLQQASRSTMIVRHGDRWLGVLGIADPPRPDIRPLLDELRGLGMSRLVMLTGDNQGVGRSVATALGLDDVRAELMPEDKVTAIQALQQEYGEVAMVGDGVNDAPALAHAAVGIAMGGAGTAVALETADVALMADDLTKLPFAVGLSRRARAIIRQNLYLSLAVIAVLLTVTVTGVAGIGAAVIAHEGSTLLVIGNALRLLLYTGPRRVRPFASAV